MGGMMVRRFKTGLYDSRRCVSIPAGTVVQAPEVFFKKYNPKNIETVKESAKIDIVLKSWYGADQEMGGPSPKKATPPPESVVEEVKSTSNEEIHEEPSAPVEEDEPLVPAAPKKKLKKIKKG